MPYKSRQIGRSKKNNSAKEVKDVAKRLRDALNGIFDEDTKNSISEIDLRTDIIGEYVNNFQNAQREGNKAIRKAPGNSGWAKMIGGYFLRKGNYDNSIELANKELKRLGLPPLTNEEIAQRFNREPLSKTDELPVNMPDPHPFPPFSEPEFFRPEEPEVPEYNGPDIGADGDFGGSGGYRGDGRYNPPTSGDDFNPRYEPDDGNDYAFDPVPDVSVDGDFGGAGGYNGGSVDASGGDSDAGGDDFSGMDMDNWAFPVLIDLDGDGIQIIPIGDSRAQFDMDDSGRKQIMAWAGADDALLVFDEDNDRVITSRNEFAFAEYLENAKTDLEGLAWFDQFAQGGNEDGVLDERDALWSKFGLWRDANQNGITDPGELRTSGDNGLQSVNLKSDQRSYEAGPDARVFGRGAYTVQDDSGQTRTGDLYDTALRYEKSPEQQSAAEIFYPSKPVKLTPEQQGYRRVRKDGQPISDAEIFYPDKSRAHEYTYVENDTVSQRQKDADLLYDHPTSQPKT
jgi:hypothetical protein